MLRTDTGAHSLESLVSEIADTQAAMIVFHVQSREEMPRIAILSKGLRDCRPEAVQVLTGPYAVHYSIPALAALNSLDIAVNGAPESALIQLYEALDTPGCWPDIAGTVYRDTSDQVCVSSRVGDCGCGIYYPSTSLHKTSVTNGRFAVHSLHFAPGGAPPACQQDPPRTYCSKSPGRVLMELEYLYKNQGARVFHVEAPCVPGESLEMFASSLLGRNLSALYGLGGLAVPLGQDLADLLFASGCRAAGFWIPSGSQRLLEDFYGCAMSISAMSDAVNACREAGMFCSVRMCYPCPWDDWHTRAETLRFLERSGAHAVSFTSPEIVPASRWYRRGSDYGFHFGHGAYQRWVLGMDGWVSEIPGRMKGWSMTGISQARAALYAACEQFGCHAGFSESEGLLVRLARNEGTEYQCLRDLTSALDRRDLQALTPIMDRVNAEVGLLSEAVSMPQAHMAQAIP